MYKKKHPNPVSNHFVYSERSRKSTCKECHFDMAGRHSENLMRHLKRKHEAVYNVVVAEKQAIRNLISKQKAKKIDDDVPEAPILSSMFHFPSEPKKIRIAKEATQSANTIAVVTTTESLDDEDEGDKENEDNGPGSQFHSIFIGKTELADEHDLSDESTTTLASSSTYGHTIAPAPAPTAARLEPIPVNDPTSSVRATPSDCPLAGEDAFYLRYLGNKLGKYSARTRSTVQFQINRILYKADLGCFEQADPQIDESDI
ncbi:uncharacterized protein LOC108092992 isoform X2 [Drosophila ficusphila]|uniref:uncharacterized protein LOC108092992 isoform X2 n=1 Tax=Drosophila ficusphila TaxID=30025 RepID=UPI0007E5E99A|nr:uncharacterized protein LOC108092992 isoform X2 [Drosophila ficusphila]